MPSNSEWDVDVLLDTLQGEIESRERCSFLASTATSKIDNNRKPKSWDEEFTAAALVTDAKKGYPVSCVFCQLEHPSWKCTVITDVKGRKSILRNKGRCFLCLKYGHVVRTCRSNTQCFKCRSRHHASICEPPPHSV